MKPFDITPIGVELYLLPVETRVPLKFGPETLTSVTVARVKMTVRDRTGKIAVGWGETPLSVQWVWPSSLPYSERYQALLDFTMLLAEVWAEPCQPGHPLEVGSDFIETELPLLLGEFNDKRAGQ